MARREVISFRTEKEGIPPGESLTLTWQVPFPFRVTKIRAYFAPGQELLLRASIHAGPRGDETDENVLTIPPGAVGYLAGDGNTVEFEEFEVTYPAGSYLTVFYKNTDPLAPKTGDILVQVEEVT